jgi:hypothetical protein
MKTNRKVKTTKPIERPGRNEIPCTPEAYKHSREVLTSNVKPVTIGFVTEQEVKKYDPSPLLVACVSKSRHPLKSIDSSIEDDTTFRTSACEHKPIPFGSTRRYRLRLKGPFRRKGTLENTSLSTMDPLCLKANPVSKFDQSDV